MEFWYFGKHKARKLKRGAFFSPEFPTHLKVENGTIDLGGHQSNLSYLKVAIAPGCMFAHVWRVTMEVVESELPLVPLW